MKSTDDNRKIGTQPDEDEIRAYEVIKWKTIISFSLDHFKNLIQQKNHANEFDDEYLGHMGERWRELQKTALKLASTVYILVIFMGAVNAGITEGVTVFGIRLSNDNSTLVVLLLISSFLLLFSSLIEILEVHYRGVVKTYIETKKNSQVADYFMLQYGWDFEKVSKDIIEGLTTYESDIRPTVITISIAITYGVTLVFIALVLITIPYYIFVSSIISVYENVNIPTLIKVISMAVALSAISLSLISYLLRAPLPYSDTSNIDKLENLEKNDPVKAERIRFNLAKFSLKKQRKNNLTLQIVVTLLSIVISYLFLYGMEFFTYYYFLIPLSLALLVLVSCTSPLLDKYETSLFLALNSISDETIRVEKYVKDKKNEPPREFRRPVGLSHAALHDRLNSS